MTKSKLKTSEEFDLFAEDLLAERSSRPLIIIGASKVDSLLVEIIESYLLPKRAKANEHDELLEFDTPLGTFSARIKICHRLGLIDETLCKVLEKLRALRNLSAHSISFDHAKSPVREHFADFRNQMASRRSYRLTKERFFDVEPQKPIEELQCWLLTLCVLLEAIRESVGRTSGHKNALRVAAN